MRLLRLGEPGAERPAVLLADDVAVDVADLIGDYDRRFFGEGGLDELRAADLTGRTPIDLTARRVGAPVQVPGKIVCIGLNYADHAAESGAPVPAEPIVFMKDPSCVVGPNDDIHHPPAATKVDWEVELAVVIGHEARYLGDHDSGLAHVAGYCVANDVSERAFQLERGGQWDKGKSCETFCPLGPWLVTPDDVADPQTLDLWLDVNGQAAQRGSTATMIFDVDTIVRYVSNFLVLHPGDVLLTGTPPGVGMGMKPPRYLVPGDVVRLGVGGLGEQQQSVVPAPGPTPSARR